MEHSSGDTEQRTAAAERKVALLTERAAQLEQLVQQMNTAPGISSSPSYLSSSSLSPSTTSFLLAQLQSLRVALAADEDEKRKLREENSKLRYRINTLLRSLSEEEKKNGGQSAAVSGSSVGSHHSQHSMSEVRQVLDKLAA